MVELTPDQERVLGEATSLLEQEELLTVWGIRGGVFRGQHGDSLKIAFRDEAHRATTTNER